MENQIKRFSLKILYHIPQSFHQRKYEIQHILNDIDILLCVVTWLTPSDRIRFSGFTPVRKDQLHSRGGVMLHKNYQCQSASRYNSIYRSPGFTLTQVQWNTLLSNVKNNSILVGDFNAHHIYWNCIDTDSNGARLVEAIQLNNFFLHNEYSTTYIDVHRDYRSNLNLVFSSNDIADTIKVEIHDETWGSDHFPIYISSVRTDKKKFTEILESNYTSFFLLSMKILTLAKNMNSLRKKLEMQSKTVLREKT
ncbi:hypothetical protein TSAR_004160 [Trichomalopsis sarcophagae]|uniref:Endonuclease/exonuclease/phosphatase domain-containing protein n=1 Tax=Trichomalopsis sarcophagae TaxID=543379 RepID=A0A232F9V3_9HYME|nr:hypothetical protein TSAR_004160 [Trichomalopsis sarcophagae]